MDFGTPRLRESLRVIRGYSLFQTLAVWSLPVEDAYVLRVVNALFV